MKRYNPEKIRSVTAACGGMWIILLLLHFYIECYNFFTTLGWRLDVTERLLGNLLRTGWLLPFTSRSLAYLFMHIMLWVESPAKKFDFDIEKYFNRHVLHLVTGFVIYYGSYVVFSFSFPFSIISIAYIGLTLTGMRLCYMGLAGLMVFIDRPWNRDDPLGKELSGFPQLEKKIETPYSLHLRGAYKYQENERSSWINLVNPRRGVFIVASPGAGKSWFIIEPFIRQWLEKGNSMFLYDYKYDNLTQVAYYYYLQNKERFSQGTAFYSINFSDISRSHRCNLIHPSTLEWISDAIGVSRTILFSMNPDWADKKGDFFVESPINFLAAVIWFLRQYKNGMYCTLPHVIELAQLPYKELFLVLGQNKEISTLINPFKEAYNNKTFNMLDGQIASARIPLSQLASPDLYYILTGDDLTLDINNPSAPKILCLGGDPRREEALKPALSLYIDRVNKICNQPGRAPCAIICDEFATVRAYSMATVIATGREHNIVPILSVQDLSQLRTNYTRNEADFFLNTSGNLFCGQVGGETAKWVSERFPQIQQEKPTIGQNSEDTNLSLTRNWEPSLTAATIGTLSSGEFVGVLSDEPATPLDMKLFHAKLIREEPRPGDLPKLPVVRKVSSKKLKAHFEKVVQDIQSIAANFYQAKKDDKETYPTDTDHLKSR